MSSFYCVSDELFCFELGCKLRDRGKAGFERLGVAGVADAHAAGLLEAVAGRDECACLMVHTGAEIVGRDIKIVIDKRGRACLRLGIEEVLGGIDPVVKNGEVRAHDAGVARDELVLMAERDGGDASSNMPQLMRS